MRRRGRASRQDAGTTPQVFIPRGKALVLCLAPCERDLLETIVCGSGFSPHSFSEMWKLSFSKCHARGYPASEAEAGPLDLSTPQGVALNYPGGMGSARAEEGGTSRGPRDPLLCEFRKGRCPRGPRSLSTVAGWEVAGVGVDGQLGPPVRLPLSAPYSAGLRGPLLRPSHGTSALKETAAVCQGLDPPAPCPRLLPGTG